MRYLLDTNVLSEPTRRAPDPGVLDGLRRHRSQVATAAVVAHELRYGAARLPEGRRKAHLQGYVEAVLTSSMPVLPYDDRAARWHADARTRHEQAGRVVPFVDGMIAATAAVNNLTVVTRNVDDFLALDVPVETWW